MFGTCEDVAVDLKRTVDAHTLLKDALRERRRGPWKVYHPKEVPVGVGLTLVVAERFDADETEVIGEVRVAGIGFELMGWQALVRGVAIVPPDHQIEQANGRTWTEFIEIAQDLVDQALGPDE